MRHIPNFITLLNLVSGCFGLAMVAEGKPQYGILAVFASAILDFFDGFAARLLKANSPIGKDLDSLSDVVSFGVLPAMLLWNQTRTDLDFPSILGYLCFFYAAMASLRLAIFNNDPSQKEEFKGMPSPAAAMMAVSWLKVLEGLTAKSPAFLSNGYTTLGISVFIGLLMVSPLTLFSLKFNRSNWNAIPTRLSWIGLSIFQILFLGWFGVFFCLIMYLVFSTVHYKYYEKR